jgi:hypothetical protein
LKALKDWLTRPTEVLPLELFRIFTGALSLAYFLQLWMEFPDYGSSAAGFLDHDLVRRIFWFTGVSLFQPGFSDGLFRGYLALGLLGSLLVLTGIYARWGALVAWLVAVSYFRWIFPVVNLNDSSVQLCLVWTMFFPVGQCLRVDEWIRRPGIPLRVRLGQWLEIRTPQAIVLMFLLHFTLAYEVAGLSKLTNSYWRQGLALYFVVRLPLAYSRHFWSVAQLPILRVLNYVSLVVEPLMPIPFWLKPWNRLKWVGLLFAFGLHGGIIATIGVVYANLTWLSIQLLVFRRELVDALRRRSQAADTRPCEKALGWGPRAAAVFILVVGLSMTEGVPGFGEAYGVGFMLQWTLGLAQEYHLFDWIDKFNYVVDNRVTMRLSDGKNVIVPSEQLFPDSLRGFLVQSYLHEMRWMRVPRGQTGELKRSLLERSAQRLARRLDQDGEVTVETTDQRETPDNLALNSFRYRVLMRFKVQDHRATMQEPY